MKNFVTLQRIGVAVILVLLLLIPALLGDQPYLMRVMTSGATMAISVYGLNIILGMTGQLSLAQAGFFGMGAYAVGILTVDHDWAFWLALPVGIGITSAIGFIAGLVALRTREEYFAVFTMGIGFIIFMAISRWESLTHAHSGIAGVKLPESFLGLDFSDPTTFYYLVLLFLFGAIYITWSISRSGVGRTLVSIRTSEDLANSIGVNVGLYKQLAFTAAAAFAGLGGGLFAAVQGFIGPTSASIDLMFEFLMYALVGGLGTVMGPVIGTFIVLGLFEFFQDLQTFRMIVLGPIIVALVIFAPRGIVGNLNMFVARLTHRKKPRPPAMTTTADAQPSSTEITEVK